MKSGDVLLLENTRFHKEEEKNDPAFVEKLAKLGDIYVNDAFSAAHRAHASTEGLAHKLPAYAGRTMQAELEALGKALEHPQRPVIAIVGGAKVSTKLDLLENLITKVQALVIGGAMANTFLHAQGVNVQKSLAEKDMADTARRILAKAESANCAIILPVDAIVAFHFQANAPSHAYGFDAIPPDGMVLDVGLAIDRAHQGRDRRCRDAGVERAARRLRDAPVRQGHRRTRALCGRTHQGRQARLGRGRRRHGRGAQPCRAWPTNSPMCRPRAARSSNGWRAARCPASRRCARRPVTARRLHQPALRQRLGDDPPSRRIGPPRSAVAELRALGLVFVALEDFDAIVGNRSRPRPAPDRCASASRGCATLRYARLAGQAEESRDVIRRGNPDLKQKRTGRRRHARRSRAACRAPCR